MTTHDNGARFPEGYKGACLCEHAKHDGQCIRYATHTVRTIFGLYEVCDNCSECMQLETPKDRAEREARQRTQADIDAQHERAQALRNRALEARSIACQHDTKPSSSEALRGLADSFEAHAQAIDTGTEAEYLETATLPYTRAEIEAEDMITEARLREQVIDAEARAYARTLTSATIDAARTQALNRHQSEVFATPNAHKHVAECTCAHAIRARAIFARASELHTLEARARTVARELAEREATRLWYASQRQPILARSGYAQARKGASPLKRYRSMHLSEAKLLTTESGIPFTDNHGHTRECRMNGAVKTWKRDPDRIEVPVKYGLKECARLSADREGWMERLLVPLAHDTEGSGS